MERQAVLFRGGIWPLVTFVVVMTLLPIGAFGLVHGLIAGLPSEAGSWVSIGMTILGASVIYLLSWGMLRWERLGSADVGFSRAHVFPGLVAVATPWALMNGLAAAIGWAVLGYVPFGLAVETTWPLWIATAVSQWFFVGPAEELGARAYLQSKVVALLGGGRSRWRKVGGILLAAVVFGLWHIPQRIFVQGMTVPQVLQDIVSLVIFALILGLLYEWTRNVVLCGLLHGMLNYEPHFFPFQDPVGMEWLSPMISLTALASIILAIWLYRRWAVAYRPGDFRPPMKAASPRRLVWSEGLVESEKEA